MSFRYIIIITICFFINKSIAQESLSIQLLDLDSHLPITEASFEYGNQTGISNEQGYVLFNYQAGVNMTLSHVAYGTWQWKDSEILDLTEAKVYYRQNEIINLYPVTIIEVRTSGQPNDKLKIDYQQRMEHDAASILNKVPAFNSIRKGGNYGYDPVFRGFKYDQLNIVLNGAQCATAACPNRMDPPTSQMAPNMMDRIEVLKGPHALRFGSAFGATINFIPSKLAFETNIKTYGRVSSAYEHNGSILRSEAQIGLRGSQYDFSLFASWSQGDDYNDGQDNLVQAGFSRGSFGSTLGIKLTTTQQIRLSGTYNIARDADFPALPMDLRTDDTWLFNARHDIEIDKTHLKSWNTTVFGSYVDHLMDNLLKPLDPRMMNARTSAKTQNYGARTEGHWIFNEAKLFAGADLRVEGAEGTRTREFLLGPNAGKTLFDNAWQDGQIRKTGIFGEYQHRAGTINVILSGRAEYNQSSIQDPSPEFIEVYPETDANQMNISFSAGVQKRWNQAFKTGIYLGHGLRSGSLTERFINYFPVGQDPFELIGNPNLKSEINNQIDLSFEWKKNKTALNLDLYASYIEDYISSVIDPNLSPRLPMSPGVRRYENIDEAFKTGFEFNWNQSLGYGLNQQLAVAYTYAQDLERDEALPETPPMDLRYTLSGQYIEGKLSPELTLRHVLSQNRISTEYGETETPSFSLIDVQLGYDISNNIKFKLGVNNLLDELYYEHLNRSVRGSTDPIYAQGRNVFTKLNIHF